MILDNDVTLLLKIIFNNDEMLISLLKITPMIEGIVIDMVVVRLASLSPDGDDGDVAYVVSFEVLVMSRFYFINLLSCGLIIFTRIWM